MLSLIPISDVNPTRRFPIITVALIAVNIVVFFTEPGLGTNEAATEYFVKNAPIPCQVEDECPPGILLANDGRFLPIPERCRPLSNCPDLSAVVDTGVARVIPIPGRGPLDFLWSVIVSTFLHAGIFHIAGNMLFLWVFGNNIEDYLGRVKFTVFYLLGGITAGFAHVLTHLSEILPAVGASGAVAAVMGAYLLLFPRARVNVLVPIFIIWTVVQMSALAVLGIWFLYQFLIAAQELSGATEVAWMAHVGGFVFGLVAILALGGRPHAAHTHWEPDWRY